MKTFSTLSKTIAFHAATSSVDLGNAGERLAIAMFEAAGFVAKKENSRHAGDIRVICPKTGEITRIEVKTARLSSGKTERYQFCLNKDGFTSCHHSNFCLLFCVYRGGVEAFLVPVEFFGNVRNFAITNLKKYRGKVAKFKIDPSNFSFVSQMELLEMS